MTDPVVLVCFFDVAFEIYLLFLFCTNNFLLPVFFFFLVEELVEVEAAQELLCAV